MLACILVLEVAALPSACDVMRRRSCRLECTVSEFSEKLLLAFLRVGANDFSPGLEVSELPENLNVGRLIDF